MPHDEDELTHLQKALGNSDTLARLRAVHRLEQLRDPSSRSVLRERIVVENNPVVKGAMQRALRDSARQAAGDNTLNASCHIWPPEPPGAPDASPFEPSAEDLAFLDSLRERDAASEAGLAQVSRRIYDLRSQLLRAFRVHDTKREDRLRTLLVAEQIALRQQLAANPLDPAEVTRLRELYRSAAAPELLWGRHNFCWVCLADVESAINRKCSCGWLICECGACQCPDFWLGIRDHQPECQEQSQRLGEAHYSALVEARQTRATNYSFARVDFGNC